MTSVCVSGVSTEAKLPVMSANEPETLVSFFSVRQKVKTTSSALKGLPFENVTPWRSLKVQRFLPSFSQDAARPGRSACFSSCSTSPSKMCIASALLGVRS